MLCYGFEIVPRRIQYCEELKLRMKQKFISDNKMLSVTERAIFLRRDCGKLEGFMDLSNRDLTHIFANNRVFSEEDN